MDMLFPRSDAFQALSNLCEAYGLPLARSQARALLAHQQQALADQGRVEFGEGALMHLIPAFYDSPFIQRDAWCSTLAALTDLFYASKNASGDAVGDEALIAQMAKRYNGRAHGSLEALGDLLDAFCRSEAAWSGGEEVRDDYPL